MNQTMNPHFYPYMIELQRKEKLRTILNELLTFSKGIAQTHSDKENILNILHNFQDEMSSIS